MEKGFTLFFLLKKFVETNPFICYYDYYFFYIILFFYDIVRVKEEDLVWDVFTIAEAYLAKLKAPKRKKKK